MKLLARVRQVFGAPHPGRPPLLPHAHALRQGEQDLDVHDGSVGARGHDDEENDMASKCPHGTTPAESCQRGCGEIADRIYQLDKSPHPADANTRAESREAAKLERWWNKNVKH